MILWHSLLPWTLTTEKKQRITKNIVNSSPSAKENTVLWTSTFHLLTLPAQPIILQPQCLAQTSDGLLRSYRCIFSCSCCKPPVCSNYSSTGLKCVAKSATTEEQFDYQMSYNFMQSQRPWSKYFLSFWWDIFKILI